MHKDVKKGTSLVREGMKIRTKERLIDTSIVPIIITIIAMRGMTEIGKKVGNKESGYDYTIMIIGIMAWFVDMGIEEKYRGEEIKKGRESKIRGFMLYIITEGILFSGIYISSIYIRNMGIIEGNKEYNKIGYTYMSVIILYITNYMVTTAILMDYPSRIKGLQDSGETKMVEKIALNDKLIYWSIIIIVIIIGKYMEICVVEKEIGNRIIRWEMVEIIYTIIPATLLIMLTKEWTRELETRDNIRYNERINMKTIGYQWYWNTRVTIIINGEEREMEYLTFTKNKEIKINRLLETDNITMLPINTNINMIMTGGDVIHSYAIPALGIKKDMIPGISNVTVMRMERESIYAGSCLEGRGTGHYSMTILIRGIKTSSFVGTFGME